MRALVSLGSGRQGVSLPYWCWRCSAVRLILAPVCPVCGLRTVDVGTATDSRGGLQSSCGTLDWCENGTEDFVQMICLQWGEQRPNDRCQTAVSEG
jgi:hypothetical protein